MTHVAAHHTAVVGDLKMHYRTVGSGEPVVLLHGWPQDSSAWDGVAQVLAGRFELIIPDLRGLGLSSTPRGGYDTDSLAEDVRSLVRGLGHDSVLVAGHDWGAATAYAYAAQHPDEVRRLAFFEMVLPGFGLMEQAMVPRPGGDFLWHMGFQSVPDLAERLLVGREDVYLGHMFRTYAYDPDAVRPDRVRHYVDMVRQIGSLRAGMEYYYAYFTSAAQNEEHRRRPLPMPVLAYGGEACLGEVPKQCLELAAGDVSGGVIPRCGHWVGEERPDFVAEVLLDFFEAAAQPDRLPA